MNAREGASQQLRFRILGPLEVCSAPGAPVKISPPLQRAALATLLLHAGQPCPRTWLTEALWDTQRPADPAGTLRTCMYALRRSLGSLGDKLSTYPGGFLIRPADGELDLQVFRALDTRGRLAWYRGDPAAAAGLLGQALRLWREPALNDLPRTPLIASETTQLLVQRAAVRETWLDTRLELGHHRDVLTQIEAFAQENPTREHVWAQLMLALYRCGDADGALRAYSAAHDALVPEYGAGPGPELVEMRRYIIAGVPPLARGPAFGQP